MIAHARSLVVATAIFTSGCVSASASRGRVEATVREALDAPTLAIAAGDEGEDADRLQALLDSPVGPDEAVAIALLGSPEVRAALEDLGVARADVLTAGAPPNVELDSEMRFGREGGPGDEVEAHVVIDLAQLLVAPLRRAAAETALRAAELETAERILMLAYRARAAVIEAQRAEARRALFERTVDVTRAAMVTASALYEAGNVPALLPATERANHASMRLLSARAELEALEAREVAVVAMGLSGAAASVRIDATLALPSDDGPSLDDLEPRAIGASLRLLRIEAQMHALEGRHGASRTAGILPELRAGVSGSYADQTFAFGPAFTIVLPIFDQRIGPTDAIEAELRRTAEEWTAAAIAVRSMVRRARNRVVSLRAQARFCEDELVPARAAVLAQTLLQYDAMAATPFAVLEARRGVLEAESTCIDVRADHALAEAALAQILAGGEVPEASTERGASGGVSARSGAGEEHDE